MPHEVEGELIQVGGTQVFQKKSYSSKNRNNIILMHGWSYTSSDWEKVDFFGQLSSIGFNVYAPDYPGFGRSPSSSKYAISRGDINKGPLFVSDYTESLGLRKVHLLGASMGAGMVVMSAIENPESYFSVTAIAPAWIENRKEDLRNVAVPVLFVWGAEDKTVPVALATEYSQLCKGSTLEIVEGAGHPVYLEKPEKFFKILLSFLKGIQS
jgi:abhydrolase domain-containing protein 14